MISFAGTTLKVSVSSACTETGGSNESLEIIELGLAEKIKDMSDV